MQDHLPTPEPPKKNALQTFWDWFVLFSGISTASNLSRTRRDPVRRRGLFLFRSGKIKDSSSATQ